MIVVELLKVLKSSRENPKRELSRQKVNNLLNIRKRKIKRFKKRKKKIIALQRRPLLQDPVKMKKTILSRNLIERATKTRRKPNPVNKLLKRRMILKPAKRMIKSKSSKTKRARMQARRIGPSPTVPRFLVLKTRTRNRRIKRRKKKKTKTNMKRRTRKRKNTTNRKTNIRMKKPINPNS